MTTAKTPVILMRTSLAEESEFEVAKKYFPVYRLRSQIPENSLVIARYSALPYYLELEEDLKANGSELINTYYQHRWIADLREWYQELEGLTPKTWFTLAEPPEHEAPFVLKGATNSRKFNWDTHMFAKTKMDAGSVYSRLSQDSMIMEQDIYVRKYVPLKRLFTGLHDLPISEEYRFFVLDGEVVSSGFYWSSHIDDLKDIGIIPDPRNVPEAFLNEVVRRIGFNARFVVIDIARTEAGDWTVIELNDGTMSGLSENSPETLYSNLRKRLNAENDD